MTIRNPGQPRKLVAKQYIVDDGVKEWLRSRFGRAVADAVFSEYQGRTLTEAELRETAQKAHAKFHPRHRASVMSSMKTAFGSH